MILYLLRESPDNSGTFVMTGTTLDTSGDAALNQAADLSASGGRFAVYPFDTVRRTVSVEPAVADAAVAVYTALADDPDAIVVKDGQSSINREKLTQAITQAFAEAFASAPVAAADPAAEIAALPDQTAPAAGLVPAPAVIMAGDPHTPQKVEPPALAEASALGESPAHAQ